MSVTKVTEFEYIVAQGVGATGPLGPPADPAEITALQSRVNAVESGDAWPGKSIGDVPRVQPDLTIMWEPPSGGGGTAATTTFSPTGTIAATDVQAAIAELLAESIALTQKAAANGVASLDGGGKVPTSQLPALAITSVFVVASQAAQLALTAEEGDVAVRSDQNKSYIHNAGSASTMADWSELLTTDTVLSVNGQTGAVTLAKADVGLGSVDNTADAAKPVSTAQQAAIDADRARLTIIEGGGVALPWVTGHNYVVGQVVINGTATYTANDTHTSGATFAGDLVAHWTLLPVTASSVTLATQQLPGGAQLLDEPPNPTTLIPYLDGYQRPAATGYEARRQWDMNFDAELDAAMFNVPANYVFDVDVLVIGTANTNANASLTSVTLTSGSIMGAHLAGLIVVGAGIPAGTRVSTATAGGTTIVMDTAATTTATGVAITLCLPCLRPATAIVATGTTTVSGSPVVTGMSTTVGMYPGQSVASNRIVGGSILTVDSASQVTVTVNASSSGAASFSAGGEPMKTTLTTKHTDIKAGEVYVRYQAKSAVSVSIATFYLLGKYLSANNFWEARKTWNPGTNSTRPYSTWKGSAFSGDVIPTVPDATLGLPHMMRARWFEDAVLIKDWPTYRLWRGAYDQTKAYFKGEGASVAVTVAGFQPNTWTYVALNDVAAGAGAVDITTDPTNWMRCEEPEWQTSQRIRAGSADAGSTSSSGTEDNVEIGALGIQSSGLTFALYEMSCIELVRREGNMVHNAQLEHIYPNQDSPLFWNRSAVTASLGTLTATRTVGSNVLTGVTGATTTPIPDAMAISGTGIANTAKIVAYDNVLNTITMNVKATAAGTTTLTMRNLMDWVSIAPPGHQKADGIPIRALRFRNTIADATFWVHNLNNAALRQPNPFNQARARIQPTAYFPRASEITMWSTAVNLRNTNGTTLNAACDFYYYNRENALLQQWLSPNTVGPIDTYFYPLGPPATASSATRTSGSNVLTGVANTIGLSVGRSIVGAGIPANTWVTAIAGQNVTMSANASASGTSVLNFGFIGGNAMGDGTGTWTNVKTKFKHVWHGNGQQPIFCRLQFGFHGASIGDLTVWDMEVRPVGGQA